MNKHAQFIKQGGGGLLRKILFHHKGVASSRQVLTRGGRDSIEPLCQNLLKSCEKDDDQNKMNGY